MLHWYVFQTFWKYGTDVKPVRTVEKASASIKRVSNDKVSLLSKLNVMPVRL